MFFGNALKAPDDPIEWFETLCEIYKKAKCKVNRETGCWIPSGRSAFTNNTICLWDKKYSLHRVFYAFYKGEIKLNFVISHKCDCPGCFNPDHLYMVTRKENMQERLRKPRWRNSVKRLQVGMPNRAKLRRVIAKIKVEKERGLADGSF